jgi:hypothetical protein
MNKRLFSKLTKEPPFGTEWLLTRLFKKTLLDTNFLVHAQEIKIYDPRQGQIDLWLKNHKDRLNLSVELKCGKNMNKKDKLKEQVIRYTDYYKKQEINSRTTTLGLGIYLHKNGIMFFDYFPDTASRKHEEVIYDLKCDLTRTLGMEVHDNLII